MWNVLRNLRTLALASALSVGFAQNASACAFHGYVPDPTLVDVLMGSEHVVLARPDPSNPRRYAMTSVLVGPTQEVDIPLLVDAQTRSRLSKRPNETVLFARDGAYGPWLKLAVMDEDYLAVVQTVVARTSAWGVGGDEERFQLFASQLSHPNADLRRLALLELDRADYSILRDLKFPRNSSLREVMQTGSEELRPIGVLLAGLSRDKALLPSLSAGLEAAVSQDLPYLGAYATALIELGGPDAATQIVNRLLSGNGLNLATSEKIIEALAIHSQTGAKKTKRAVRRSVGALLDQSPELAAPVARQFGFRGDWSMSDALKRAVAARPPKTVQDIFAINQYIGVANRSN